MTLNSIMLTNFVALTAGLATTVSAFTCSGNYFSFFNRGGDTLSYARLDPSLYPGETSPHLHSFDGGSGLGASTSFKDTQDSKCTTARIKQDKSLYWRPSLFWNGNGTGLYRVPEQNTKIYYKFGESGGWANVTGFPEEFNMMAGFPNKRSDGDNPAGVRWGCHQPDGRDDKIFSNGFPTGFQSCKYGFASEVTFPSCWNGEKTNPKDAHAHMAYPESTQGTGVENCPSTHRAARFPTIFIEFWYDISTFDGQYSAEKSPWVLSNGDLTGFGFHGDFLNGWETGVLEKATAEQGGCYCGCGCGQAEMEQCFGSENVNKNDDPEFMQCSVVAANSAEAAPKLETLPGCNSMTSGPADAVPATGSNCGGAAYEGGSVGDAPAASKMPGITPSPSKETPSKAEASSVAKDDDKPSVAISIPNKQLANPTPVASEQYGAAPSPSSKATPAASSAFGSGFSVETPIPSESTGTPSQQGDCKAPVYVTVTPTIYVTAGSDTTSCAMGTLTKTLTETATVTVPAIGGVQYGSF